MTLLLATAWLVDILPIVFHEFEIELDLSWSTKEVVDQLVWKKACGLAKPAVPDGLEICEELRAAYEAEV